MLNTLFTGPIVYKDKLIRWIAIPVIVLLSHYLTYNGSDSAGWFIYELISDGIKIALVWTVVKCCIYFLDWKLPWSGNFITRLLCQLLLTSAAGMLTLTGLQLIDYGLIRSYSLDHYSFDLVIAMLFILIVNAIYIILYYRQSLLSSYQDLEELKSRQVESQRTKSFLIRLGKKQLLIPFEKMAGFYAANKNTTLFTIEGQTYPVDQSLDQLEKEPCAAKMYRVNRQYLLAPGFIRSIQAESNGKLNVFLQQSPSKEPFISVSRDKASSFRQWLKTGQAPVHP